MTKSKISLFCVTLTLLNIGLTSFAFKAQAGGSNPQEPPPPGVIQDSEPTPAVVPTPILSTPLNLGKPYLSQGLVCRSDGGNSFCLTLKQAQKFRWRIENNSKKFSTKKR